MTSNEFLNDEIDFTDESSADFCESGRKWKVLISDDDEDVHAVSRVVLNGFEFEGCGLEVLSAYSAAETRKVLGEHKDIAIVLLDVVMEHDDSGLNLVRYIRENLNNQFIRIILRTGQPGQAPETQVIKDYDINDYKQKTELTAQKLLTAVVTALRAYRDLRTIEHNRVGLERIIKATKGLFEVQTVRHFVAEVLDHLHILMCDENQENDDLSAFLALKEENNGYVVFSGTGVFKGRGGMTVKELIPESLDTQVEHCMRERSDLFMDREYVNAFRTKDKHDILLYVSSQRDISRVDKKLLEMFSANIAVAFDNVYLSREIIDTQKELTFILGEVIEKRSHETANHVRRVAALSRLMAEKIGLSEDDAELIEASSPLHDVGKIGIPDSILNKPGKLTEAEFEVMKSHAAIGYELLRYSKRPILRTAAIIAHQHQEKWDGSGYPQGLKKDDIHIFSRITTLVDVFDALSQKRVYKEAWDTERVFEYMKEGRGSHFDPHLVDVFMDNKDDFLKVLNMYPDED